MVLLMAAVVLVARNAFTSSAAPQARAQELSAPAATADAEPADGRITPEAKDADSAAPEDIAAPEGAADEGPSDGEIAAKRAVDALSAENPIRPPVKAPEPAPLPPLPSHALSCVMDVSGAPWAIIDGHVVRVGQTIDGATVRRIDPVRAQVTVVVDGRAYLLRIGRPASRVDAATETPSDAAGRKS
jgi:hypothetical protein